MKRILIVHSFYGSESPSGENSVVEEDVTYLKNIGFEVNECFLFSDVVRSDGALGELRASIYYLFGLKGLLTLRKACREFKPDIIHVHNVFPMFSLWILYYASTVASVFYTWHNYRNICIAGFPLREGKVCRKCIDSVQLHALKHRCYKGSYLGSFVLFLSNVLHKNLRTINRNVDKLVCFTHFQKNVLLGAGIDEGILHIKPNFSDIVTDIIPYNERENYVVFAGRISSEKGIPELLSIWSLSSGFPNLKVCGSGPLLSEMRKVYGSSSNIEFHGLLSKPTLDDIMSRAKAIIVPSIAWEGYPMVIADAEKLGTPVFSSGVGPLGDMIVHKDQLINFDDSNKAKEILSTRLNNRELLKCISDLQLRKSKENVKRKEYLNLYE